jgi:hypothetical protein
MGLSCRRFLIARDDSLYRLPNTTFDRMLRDPANHRLAIFAGQRVRMADLIVELADGGPRRVVRSTFAVLAFDDEGGIDSARFEGQQFALAESALAPVFAVPERDDTVVDAAHRFVAHGGAWTPSSSLARSIEEAALGRVPCRRL